MSDTPFAPFVPPAPPTPEPPAGKKPRKKRGERRTPAKLPKGVHRLAPVPTSEPEKAASAPPKKPRKARVAKAPKKKRGMNMATVITALAGMKEGDTALLTQIADLLGAVTPAVRTRVVGALGKLFG